MNELDRKILLICKTKRKIPRIRKLLSNPLNFVFDNDENVYKVHSLTSNKIYQVFYTEKNKWNCDCIYNYKYKIYREGMKRHEKIDYCIHILATQCYLVLKGGQCNC